MEHEQVVRNRAEAALQAADRVRDGAGDGVPAVGVMGAVREEVLALRREATAAIAEIDADIAALLERRRELVRRVRAAEDALHGSWRATRRRRRDHPLDLAPIRTRTCPPAERRLLRGGELRQALLAVLAGPGRAIPMGLTVGELVALLGEQDAVVPGRPSHTVSNALGVEVRAGRVERTARGRYRLALPR